MIQHEAKKSHPTNTITGLLAAKAQATLKSSELHLTAAIPLCACVLRDGPIMRMLLVIQKGAANMRV